MPTVYELNRSQLENDNARGRATRFFLVEDIDTEDINSGASIAGLPNVGDPFSAGQPGLIARNRRATAVANGFRTSNVEVIYSTDGYGKIAPQPPDLSQGQAVGLSFETRTVRIPIATLVPRTISGGGSSVDTAFWEVSELSYQQRMAVRTVTVELQSFGSTEIELIAAQADKIHRINGVDYLFQPSPVPASLGPWRATYSWLLDPGTPNLPFAGAADVLVPAGPGAAGLGVDPTPASGLMRDPYHSLSVIASDDPENIPPDIAQRPDYAEDLNGWQSLPGITSL